MENEWINPVSGDATELVSLSTGTVAPSDVSRDLLTAKEIGDAAYKLFQENRIEKGKPLFHDPLPKQKLKTFSDVRNPKVIKRANKEAATIADHQQCYK